MKRFLLAVLVLLLFFITFRELTAYQKNTSKVQSQSPTPTSPVVQNNERGGTLYPVVKVVDGDTIDVQFPEKIERVRLIGMDTPEIVDPRKPVQCFGKEASDKAKEILTGHSVQLEPDPTQGDKDKYGRLLRFVFLEDGTLFNKLMIEQGYAHEYTYQSNPYKYQAEFKMAERQARDQNLGLWSPAICPQF